MAIPGQAPRGGVVDPAGVEPATRM